MRKEIILSGDNTTVSDVVKQLIEQIGGKQILSYNFSAKIEIPDEEIVIPESNSEKIDLFLSQYVGEILDIAGFHQFTTELISYINRNITSKPYMGFEKIYTVDELNFVLADIGAGYLITTSQMYGGIETKRYFSPFGRLTPKEADDESALKEKVVRYCEELYNLPADHHIQGEEFYAHVTPVLLALFMRLGVMRKDSDKSDSLNEFNRAFENCELPYRFKHYYGNAPEYPEGTKIITVMAASAFPRM